MHFRFRAPSRKWRYYLAERWFDARGVAAAHFGCEPGALEWELLPDRKASTGRKTKFSRETYKLTWGGSDAGVRPDRAMTVTRVS